MDENSKRDGETSGGKDLLEEEIRPLVEGMGFLVVEAAYQRAKAGIRIYLVIHRAEGVGMEDTAEVYRAVYPRLEVLFDSRDIHLEISSPGVSRKIKSNREYEIFTGQKVKVLPMDSSEWYKGHIKGVLDGKLELDVKGKTITLPLTDIKKAQLLFEWGNGEKK